MLEEKKMHEKKEMGEWGLLEQSGDDDYQAMLCYYMEKEMKQILTKLREKGCSRTHLKDIVDEICNNVKKGKNERRTKKGI